MLSMVTDTPEQYSKHTAARAAQYLDVAKAAACVSSPNDIGPTEGAWVDWPGHIWAQSWNEGPDGMVVQFDRGSVWVRNIAPPPPVHTK